MIRKSGDRLSEKIMLNQSQERDRDSNAERSRSSSIDVAGTSRPASLTSERAVAPSNHEGIKKFRCVFPLVEAVSQI